MTMSTPDDQQAPRETHTARAPSAGRRRQQRRIVQTTRALAVGGVAATAAFALAAAHSGGTSATTTSPEPSSAGGDAALVPSTSLDGLATDDGGETGQEWEDGEDDGSAAASIAPAQVAPMPTFAPPVAQSGGS
jgi:hypothetical protein